ncbi:NB-ARC domain-containing protein [Streptomyces alboflavus]|uniref:NB-ARC domain-containing protein n=1 Tax=Streptomyces alboflavus TaxID=67267 RepID=UPI000F658962|nr:NB-ARC domain-containing protein [Streptomyces alboflavus]
MTGSQHSEVGGAGAVCNLITGGTARSTTVQAGTVGRLHINATASARPPAPRQLLPVPGTWTDRRTVLRDLDAAAAAAHAEVSTLVVVSGGGGVGKTAMANKWLRSHAADTPDGQLYADLTRTPEQPTSALVQRLLRHFLRSVGHDPGTDQVQELAAWWRSASHGHRFGVLLDNACGAEDVLPLLPGDTGHLIVVTSREPLPALRAQGATACELQPLEPAAAERLLPRIVGAERTRGQRTALETVARGCGCLPLALVVAATGLSTHPARPLSVYAHGLSTNPEHHERAIMTVLERQYADLGDDAARRAYRLLSTVPLSEIETDAVANVCDLSHEDAAAVLRCLAGTRLFERLGPRPGRGVTYRYHDAVRAHAQQLAEHEDGEAAIEDAVLRAGTWLLATLTRAERILTPHHRRLARNLHHHVPAVAFAGDDHMDALRWVEAHMPDVELMVRDAMKRRWYVLVWQLVHAAWPGVHHLRLLTLSYELHRLGVEAAVACGDRLAQREMLTTGVIALRGLQQLPEACAWAEQAAELAREDGDLQGLGQATHELGVCSRALGDKGAAAQYLVEAFAFRTELGDCRAMALTGIVQGQLDLDDDQPLRAIDRVGPAHVDLRQVGDSMNAGRACLVLADAYARIGLLPRAVELLGMAERYFQVAPSQSGQARVLRMRGQLAEQEDDFETARSHYSAALLIYKRTSPHDLQELTAHLRTLPEECQEAEERASPSP